jgi:hypothetical protein
MKKMERIFVVSFREVFFVRRLVLLVSFGGWRCFLYYEAWIPLEIIEALLNQ